MNPDIYIYSCLKQEKRTCPLHIRRSGDIYKWHYKECFLFESAVRNLDKIQSSTEKFKPSKYSSHLDENCASLISFIRYEMCTLTSFYILTFRAQCSLTKRLKILVLIRNCRVKKTSVTVCFERHGSSSKFICLRGNMLKTSSFQEPVSQSEFNSDCIVTHVQLSLALFGLPGCTELNMGDPGSVVSWSWFLIQIGAGTGQSVEHKKIRSCRRKNIQIKSEYDYIGFFKYSWHFQLVVFIEPIGSLKHISLQITDSMPCNVICNVFN